MLPRLASHSSLWLRSALAAEPRLDYAAVFRLARAGDPCSVALRDHSLRVWGVHAANLVLAYDPARVVIGGGIAKAPEVVPAIRDYIHAHALTPWGRISVVPAELGDDAALLGCEWLGRRA